MSYIRKAAALLKKVFKSVRAEEPTHTPGDPDFDCLIEDSGVNFACDTFAVDIGASYYPHPAWRQIRQNSSATWVAVDPNANNLEYVKTWPEHYKCQIKTCSYGLNDKSGVVTLFRTNTDSGSSLLPVNISPDWIPRLDQSYFYPIQEVAVECKTFDDAMNDVGYAGSCPLWLKLDTQGTELRIIKAINDQVMHNDIVLIESECTLQLQPTMVGSGNFSQMLEFAKKYNLELIFLKPIPVVLNLTNGRQGFGPINECDAAFALSPTYAIRHRPLTHNLSLIAAYITYNLIGEASIHAARIAKSNRFDIPDSTKVLLLRLSKLANHN